MGQNAAHVLGGELGVFVNEIEADRPTVDDWQRMAQLKSSVASIADVVQAQRFREGFLIALDGDAIRAAVVFAAEMPQRLQRADFVDRLTNGGLVQTVLEAGIEADLEMGRSDFLHHSDRHSL